MLREEDLHHGFLVVALVVNDCPLLQHISFLVDYILVYFTELLRKWRLVLWHEQQRALASLQLQLDLGALVHLRVPEDVVHVEHLVSEVLLQVDAECLGQVLLLVRVLEEHLSFVGYSLDLQIVNSICDILRFFLVINACFVIGEVADDLDDEHLVRLNERLQEHLVVDELLAVLLPVLLLEHVALNLDE